jgi:predicted nucleotide-binding protein (sugar kinase/HSP70/actin superfamily)
MRVCFPTIGNQSLGIRKMFENMGVECITYDRTRPEHIKWGIMNSPEHICFCYKAAAGGLHKALDDGADTIIIFDTKGRCRLHYYGLLLGIDEHRAEIKIWDKTNLVRSMSDITGKGRLRTVKGMMLGLCVALIIEALERKLFYLRPREKNVGDSDNGFARALEILGEVKGFKDLLPKRNDALGLMNSVYAKDINAPRVLVLGEIFMVNDDECNQGLLKKVGRLGFEIVRPQSVASYFYQNWVKGNKRKLTMNYLRNAIGGDAMANVDEVLHAHVDGIIHVAPFGCMPEVSVNPILAKIAGERMIPYLFLTFDEHTSCEGLETRLEAFSEMVNSVPGC